MAGRGRRIRRIIEGKIETPELGDGPKLRIMAKYTYKARLDMPGGFQEVDMNQFDKLWLLKKGYKDNMHWWQVETDDGRKGFAPAQYLTLIEEGVSSSLPWLTKVEEQSPEPASTPPFPQQTKVKHYVPTYKENANEKTDHYCKICERKFNGPIPYRAHINSKAHKEEVRIAQEYNQS